MKTADEFLKSKTPIERWDDHIPRSARFIAKVMEDYCEYKNAKNQIDEDAAEIVKKHFPYCFDEVLGFDAVGSDFVKLLSEQINNWKTMNKANAKMGARINDLEGAIKKYCWHWDSYFSNKIVGNPPVIQDLKDLINEAR
jgi:hypothetical protein